MTTNHQLLIIDDDSDAVLSLSRLISSAAPELSVSACTTATKALELLEEKNPAVAILDLSLNEQEGVESGFQLLKEILRVIPSCRVIVLTGHGSIQHGVRALQLGAASFLEKPAEIDHLLALVIDGARQAEIRREFERLKHQGSHDLLDGMVLGESKAIEKVRESIRYAAQTPQAVLITGETGTGKGLCANSIHRLSSRSQQSFIRFQPSFSNADLVGSELFGHKKGAFTGADRDRAGLLEEVQGGTLFLDEIDELPVETQVNLLGVLQDRKFRPLGSNQEKEADFRLVCASNASIEEAIAAGKLRSDFFHRIAHFQIALPPLRERKEDIDRLADHLIGRTSEREGFSSLLLAPDALKSLKKYNWPGNIRELEAVVEGACYRAVFHQRREIIADDISCAAKPSGSSNSLSFHDQLAQFKFKLVSEALENNDGNQVQAAKALGLDRSSFRRILNSERE